MTYRQWPQQQFGMLQRLFLPVVSIFLVGLLWIAYARPFEALTISPPDFGRSSLSFIPNAGQSDINVQYMSNMPRMGFFFTEEGVTFSGTVPEEESSAVVRWHFAGADPAKNKSINQLPGVANYLKGANSSEWLMGLPTFRNVQYEELYPGIDMAVSGSVGYLATAIEIAPGANPEKLVWRFEGAEPTLNSETGALILSDKDGRIMMTFERPIASQQIGGELVPVIANFVIHDNGTIGVAAAITNKAKSLSLLLGVNLQTNMATDEADAVVTNASFESFVTGITSSPLFPTVNPLQGAISNQYDTFITKFSADGDVLYSTYLGGNGRDYVDGIDLDPDGNIIVTGQTLSTDFPLANPIFGTLADRDAFVSKISANGSQLLFSSYIGGSDWDSARDLSVDDQGDIYLVGQTLSTNYPLQNPLQNTSGGEYDAFLSKISGDTYQLVFSTYLGGSESDYASGIDTDQSGNVFVTGGTNSADFPVINTGIPQPQVGMDIDNAYITKITADGSAIIFSSLFGGNSDDVGRSLSVDPLDNNVYIGGWTISSNFPVVNPIQSVKGGNRDAFITRVAGNGSSILFSTYFGGIYDDYATSIKVGGAGNVFVTGFTASPDFPQLNPLPGMGYPGGIWDGFVLMHSPSGNLVWSTYLGGTNSDQASSIDVDSIGRPVVVGQTFSTDFPTVNAFQPNLSGGSEAFVSRLSHAGNMLEFSTFLGGASYPGGPTEVNVRQIEGTPGTDLSIYLLGLGLLAVLILGVWLTNSKRSK
jgi:hypothetical protein